MVLLPTSIIYQKQSVSLLISPHRLIPSLLLMEIFCNLQIKCPVQFIGYRAGGDRWDLQ